MRILRQHVDEKTERANVLRDVVQRRRLPLQAVFTGRQRPHRALHMQRRVHRLVLVEDRQRALQLVQHGIDQAQRRARGQLARARALTGDQSSGLVDAASAVAAPPAISAPLLGLLRCRQATLDRLAPEAREQCLERLAVIDSPPPRVDLDLTGRYARDRTPYLARPPKNGCKLVSGVADGVNGTVDGKMGVGCAFSF